MRVRAGGSLPLSLPTSLPLLIYMPCGIFHYDRTGKGKNMAAGGVAVEEMRSARLKAVNHKRKEEDASVR